MSVTCKLNIAREATQTHSWAFRIRHTARRKIIFLFFLIESINNQMHCLDFSPHRRLSWLSARLFSFKEPNSKDFLALETFPRNKKKVEMDSTPLNWEALDALIIDFAKSENLIEDEFSSSSPPSSPSSSCSSYSSSSLSSSSYHSRLIIWKIRRSLEAGDIEVAMDLLHSHAPFILDDRRLLFLLQKQVCIVLFCLVVERMRGKITLSTYISEYYTLID